jgi:hypothetical protein
MQEEGSSQQALHHPQNIQCPDTVPQALRQLQRGEDHEGEPGSACSAALILITVSFPQVHIPGCIPEPVSSSLWRVAPRNLHFLKTSYIWSSLRTTFLLDCPSISVLPIRKARGFFRKNMSHEMNQALYAHMNNKRKRGKKKKYEPDTGGSHL